MSQDIIQPAQFVGLFVIYYTNDIGRGRRVYNDKPHALLAFEELKSHPNVTSIEMTQTIAIKRWARPDHVEL